MNKEWKSLQIIHQLYRRHTVRHILTFLLLLLTAGGLLVHFFYMSTILFSLGAGWINFLFVLSVLVFTVTGVSYLSSWAKDGIRYTTFSRRWEASQPQLANRTSLMVYAERHPDEVERLGYSKDLLQADDIWLENYVQRNIRKESLLPVSLFIAFLLIFGSIGMFAAFHFYQPPVMHHIVQALFIRDGAENKAFLKVPDVRTVERGKPVTLLAQASGELEDKRAFIHIGGQGEWTTAPVMVQQKRLVYVLPALRRELTYYFSQGAQVSNQGKVVPLDAPTITQGTLAIQPPEYTRLPSQSITNLQPISVPEGSQIHINAQASSELVAAKLHFRDQEIPVQRIAKQVQGTFQAEQSGEFHFTLQDTNHLVGQSMPVRITAIPDATPIVEIVQPETVADVPDLLTQRVIVHVTDDYQVQKVLVHSQINQSEESNRENLVWEYTSERAKDVGSTTDFFITFDWDLSLMDIFPGDEMTYYVEVWDNDAIHGSKSGRSQTNTLKYPSLVDLLHQLDQMEEQQREDLSEVVDKQEDISNDAEEVIEKIREKISSPAMNEEGNEEMWLEKQELEAIKKRQEELVQEAKKVEAELQKYQEQAQEQLTEEEKKAQGFTPETLEKMERIRELLSELIDKDSQQLLQKIEQTVEQLSRDINTEQLDDLNFSFQDFDQQLERTLSMLESTQQQRQLEGLRNMTMELAERQDHLQRETEEISKQIEQLEQELAQHEQNKPQDADQQNQPGENQENQPEHSEEQSEEMKQWQEQKAELEKRLEEMRNKEQMMAERQRRLEEDTQNLMDKMSEVQENMEEKNPALAQQLQNMQQQARESQMQQEMNQATQKLQQQQSQQAQQHQQNAQKQLAQLAEQMQQEMFNMGGMDMQMDTREIKRLIDRGLFLSHEFEPLTDPQTEQRNPLTNIRLAQAFLKEMNRILEVWTQMSMTNPFMGREVGTYLRRGQERLQTAIAAGQGEKWVGLHESRQSLIALNQAIFMMLQNMQSMQQQQQQSGAESLQQQMQQMISQQQSLQQMLQQLRNMGEKGEQMLQQLQQMAQQQAQIRKGIEEMMQQYRNAEQLRNRLEGIHQEMEEVEKLLEEGINDEQVEEKQKRIMTRMLEAGTMQEKDEFGRERKAETVKTGQEGSSPDSDIPMTLQEKLQNAVQRPDYENIPVQYREAIKNHYIQLSEQMAQ